MKSKKQFLPAKDVGGGDVTYGRVEKTKRSEVRCLRRNFIFF